MIWILLGIVIFYVLGCVFAPFPHWRTYLLLWKAVLFNRLDTIPARARIRQALFLLQYAFLCPFYTLLWYLDEILYPSYKHLEIKPVFVIGEPRSGTTFLHRTLAADEETFFAIRHIEWRFPFITVQKFIKFFGLESRIKKINYWPNTEAGLKAAKMHANNLYDYEEDGIFFEERFLFHFYIMLRLPYRDLLPLLDNFDVLSDDDQRHMLDIHKKVIQKIMYYRGENKIYLSKEVTSHTKFRRMVKMYPQATFIINLRQSSDFMSSLLELIQLSTLSKTDVDIFTLEGFESMYLERMRRDCLILLDFLKQDISQKRLCISYQKLTQNTKETVEYIYRECGLSLPSSYKKYLEHLQVKQKERDRNYAYQNKSFTGFEEFDTLVSQIDKQDSS